MYSPKEVLCTFFGETISLSEFLFRVHLKGILSVMETSHWSGSQFLPLSKVLPGIKFIHIVIHSDKKKIYTIIIKLDQCRATTLYNAQKKYKKINKSTCITITSRVTFTGKMVLGDNFIFLFSNNSF